MIGKLPENTEVSDFAGRWKWRAHYAAGRLVIIIVTVVEAAAQIAAYKTCC